MFEPTERRLRAMVVVFALISHLAKFGITFVFFRYVVGIRDPSDLTWAIICGYIYCWIMERLYASIRNGSRRRRMPPDR